MSETETRDAPPLDVNLRVVRAQRNEAWAELQRQDAELARLRGVVEAVQAVADEWADDCAIAAVVGCGTRLRRVLASVPSTESDPTALGRVVALADEWEQRSVDSAVDCTDDRMTPGEACSALRAALAPVSSSGEAESGQAVGDRWDGTPLYRCPSCGRLTANEPPRACEVCEVCDDTAAPVPSGGRDLLAALGSAVDKARQDRRATAAPSGGQADGEGNVPCLICGGLNGRHSVVHVRHGNGGHNEPCPYLAARPVLSREALRERLNGHWPSSTNGCLDCDCGWREGDESDPRLPTTQWYDHLADVLAGVLAAEAGAR